MRRKLVFIFFIILLFLVNSLSPILGLKFQFIIIGIVNYIFCIYLLRNNSLNKTGWFLIFLYPILITLTFLHALFNNFDSFRGLLTVLISILSSLFAILTFLNRKNFYLLISYSLIYVLLVVNYENVFNYYLDEVQNEGITNLKFPVFNLEDENANLIEFPKGKVLVVDLWTSNCLYCIESFPEFEELKNQYKNDKEVDFLSINIYKTQNEKERSLKYLKKFTFNNYYHDFTLFNKLNFNSVPNYVVINKKGDITYFGSLNTGKFETFNNIHEIIKKSK